MSDPLSTTVVHAFGDDVLGEHDAVSLAELIRAEEADPAEVARAAVERVRKVGGDLHAVQVPAYDRAVASATGGSGVFAGVPTFIKDNIDYRGLPTGFGSAAYVPRPARRHAPFARQFLSTGVTVLGKTRLPEFGFNATTEFENAAPVCNPWHTGYSAGGSSGGSAALVAAGAVPIAHANDGGGSIRIPAACCGLVGLKATRGRLVANEEGRTLPINLVSDGVLSRSVRDTAAFFAAAEEYWRNPKLPPLGLVEGPSQRRLRIGLLLDSPTGATTDAATRAAVTDTAAALEKLGHTVEPVRITLDGRFAEDFITYWGLLSFLVGATGKRLDRHFDRRRMDGLSQGLRAHYRRRLGSTPAVLRRLSRSREAYAAAFRDHDLVLSPVLAHTTPRLGHLSPDVPYETLIERLTSYVAFTPLNNVVGSPAISLPASLATEDGLPIGVMFSGRNGDERTLLEIAFALEADRPWRRIQDRRPPTV
ncbi:amidase [Streptomyces lunaelactis]|uniref:Amidase n=1 Tax=Streptomyces lunaelactis TaxID=1535768 RepID=A0A2R4SXH2_9ACTN|nr:amidase [Streptomyces lunaelactis]AVZ71573.1 amidase [Streptomyces lunaelactis]NUK87695.1 amidase [Streptomyces lunaelactis]